MTRRRRSLADVGAELVASQQVRNALATRQQQPPGSSRAAADTAQQDSNDDTGPSALQRVRDRLGLPPDTSTDEIVAAVLARVDDPPAVRAPRDLPEGVVTIEATEYDRLVAEAQRPEAIARDRDEAEHARIVDAAINRGAIAPARAETYMHALDVDRAGTTELLAGIPDQHAVPTAAIGRDDAADYLGGDALQQLYGD